MDSLYESSLILDNINDKGINVVFRYMEEWVSRDRGLQGYSSVWSAPPCPGTYRKTSDP